MNKKFGIWLFMAAVVLLPSALFAVVKWYERSYTSLPVLGPAQHTLASFTLLNQEGKNFGTEQLEGKIVIANLFFSHCPVVCPKMIRNLKNVQQLYAGEKDLVITSFTVDPERDSVSRLKQFSQLMDLSSNWHLLTGSKREIYKFARKSLLVVATDGDGGPTDFIHSELLVLIDKEKRIRGYYNGTKTREVETLVKDISRLKRTYPAN